MSAIPGVNSRAELAALRVREVFSGRYAAYVPLRLPAYVAHAGGGYKGLMYTNSRQALDESYSKGFRAFEVDFSWTTDRQLVLLHDWGTEPRHLFYAPPGVHTLAEFVAFKSVSGFTQLTSDGFADWLRAHPDALAITDTKENPLPLFSFLAARYPDLVPRIIPQIYRFSQYPAARKAGFNAVILTLYTNSYPDAAVLAFVKRHPVAAVTMPDTRASSPLVARLRAEGVAVYAHTINDEPRARQLFAEGFSGIYTAFLAPQP